MKVRGERECTDCGARWSYYETGEISCPECESLRSVGVDEERKRHTDAPTTLDLAPFREAVAMSEPWGTGDASDVRLDGLEAVADDLASTLREYLRRRGFISGGELLPLDDTYLAARELLEAIDVYGRLRDPGEEETLYVLELLRGADAGNRPDPGTVPTPMREARGMAAALSVEAYREEVATHLADRDDETDGQPPVEVTTVLGRLRDREKRLAALQGDVEPGEADALVSAARDLGAYLRNEDLDALVRAHDRLTSVD